MHRLLPLLLGLAACNGISNGNDTQDSLDPFRPELLIIAVEATCDNNDGASSETWEAPNDDLVELFVRNELWADRVEWTMTATDDAGMSETHLLPDAALSNFDDDGSWDEWTWQLAEVASADDVGAGFTQFNCHWFHKDTSNFFDRTAFRVQVYEENATEPKDCVIFGRGSRTAYGADCACAEEWSNSPPAVPCGD